MVVEVCFFFLANFFIEPQMMLQIYAKMAILFQIFKQLLSCFVQFKYSPPPLFLCPLPPSLPPSLPSERSTETGVFLINICASLVALCVCYIVSTYATTNTVVCQVFSFLLHFTLLVSAGAIAIMLLFMIRTPYTATAKRIAFTAAIAINLCK